MLGDGRAQVLAVVDGGDDVDAVLGEDEGDPVAQQRVVLGEGDAHG